MLGLGKVIYRCLLLCKLIICDCSTNCLFVSLLISLLVQCFVTVIFLLTSVLLLRQHGTVDFSSSRKVLPCSGDIPE